MKKAIREHLRDFIAIARSARDRHRDDCCVIFSQPGRDAAGLGPRRWARTASSSRASSRPRRP